MRGSSRSTIPRSSSAPDRSAPTARRAAITIVGWGNFRIDALQCAILRVKLRHLDAENEGRRKNADLYGRLFAERRLLDWVRPPAPEGASRHSYHQYTIEVGKRDALAEFLGKRQIGCGVYYPVPLHLQECFAPLGSGAGSFPNAEATAGRVLSLPIHGRLRPQEIERVVSAIGEFFGKKG